MVYQSKRNGLTLFFLVLVCGLIGGILGEILGEKVIALSFLRKYFSIGLTKPLYLDLKIMTLTLGFELKVNILSLLGIVSGYLIYRKIK